MDYFFLIDTAKSTPSTMPSNAAKSTRCSDGNKNVIVWAGYQKNGIVFLNTKPHCACQFSSANRLAMGMGVTRVHRLPPLRFWRS